MRIANDKVENIKAESCRQLTHDSGASIVNPMPENRDVTQSTFRFRTLKRSTSAAVLSATLLLSCSNTTLQDPAKMTSVNWVDKPMSSATGSRSSAIDSLSSAAALPSSIEPSSSSIAIASSSSDMVATEGTIHIYSPWASDTAWATKNHYILGSWSWDIGPNALMVRESTAGWYSFFFASFSGWMDMTLRVCQNPSPPNCNANQTWAIKPKLVTLFGSENEIWVYPDSSTTGYHTSTVPPG